jgi:hypothetical protein
MYDIFYVSRTKGSDEDWKKFKSKYPIAQRLCNIESYEDIRSRAFTKMFWVIWDDLEIGDDLNLLEYKATKWDDMYVHVFKNGKHYDGICLFPKSLKISQKEFHHRFFTDKKEIDIVVSNPKRYNIYSPSTFEEYQIIDDEIFWLKWPEIEVIDDAVLDLYFSHHNVYDRRENHIFKNSSNETHSYINGLVLCSKYKPLSKREFNLRYAVDKKEYDIVATKSSDYDIIFISYEEPNAEENYENLITRFPKAKRIHGVKGIHQAHIKAAEIASTFMFWVVDGDAIIEGDFNFDFKVSRWEKDIVHVWRSKNPINDLVYGYGGVKLLPRDLTLNMDVSTPDMTTSISNQFKAMESISNITAFNTDSFNTWKSAFRECVKLASRSIERQFEEETATRLEAWCTTGIDKKFGEDAIRGALEGKKFGEENKNNPVMLSKINDFDWLKQQYGI